MIILSLHLLEGLHQPIWLPRSLVNGPEISSINQPNPSTFAIQQSYSVLYQPLHERVHLIPRFESVGLLLWHLFPLLNKNQRSFSYFICQMESLFPSVEYQGMNPLQLSNLSWYRFFRGPCLPLQSMGSHRIPYLLIFELFSMHGQGK